MNIVIFGIGCVYLKKKKYFFNDNIVAYIDNNVDLVGSSIDGICVHKVENIKELTYDYIIPMSLDTKNMIAQLLQYGVDADKILLFEDYCAIRLKNIDFHSEKNHYGASDIKGKVLLVVPVIDDSGVPVVNFRLADLLVRKHYDVTILAPFGEERIIKNMVKKGISVSIIPSLISYKYANFSIKQDEFDLIIANSPGNWPFVAKVGWNNKIHWWFHDPMNVYQNEIHKIQKYIQIKKNKDGVNKSLFCKKNIAVHAVSEIAAKVFISIFGEIIDKNVDILPYALPDISNGTLNVKSDKIIFSIIGYSTPIKGQDIFVNAVKKMKYSDKAEFWIVGLFDETTRFCKSILENIQDTNNIKIKGIIPNEQMEKLYSEIDVVVSASRQDMLPTVLAEGMQHKKICITSDCTGMADFISDMDNGFVFEAENENQLAEKMDYIINNFEYLRYIEDNAYKTYKTNFSENILYKRIEKMINI